MFRTVRSVGSLSGRFHCSKRSKTLARRVLNGSCPPKPNVLSSGATERLYHHVSQSGGDAKLDEFFPEVVDFPGRHIGPRCVTTKSYVFYALFQYIIRDTHITLR